MNNEGHVKNFESLKDAISEGYDTPVNVSELTKQQKTRFDKNLQPVVKMADHRSVLGKKLLTKNQEKRLRKKLKKAVL